MENKSPEAFRTISEVAEWLGTPTHVLRFWESRFSQVKPVKRAGGRRYYRPADMMLLGGIKRLLHEEGMTIRGVQKLLREKGVKHVASLSPPLQGPAGTVIEGEILGEDEAGVDALAGVQEHSHADGPAGGDERARGEMRADADQTAGPRAGTRPGAGTDAAAHTTEDEVQEADFAQVSDDGAARPAADVVHIDTVRSARTAPRPAEAPLPRGTDHRPVDDAPPAGPGPQTAQTPSATEPEPPHSELTQPEPSQPEPSAPPPAETSAETLAGTPAETHAEARPEPEAPSVWGEGGTGATEADRDATADADTDADTDAGTAADTREAAAGESEDQAAARAARARRMGREPGHADAVDVAMIIARLRAGARPRPVALGPLLDRLEALRTGFEETAAQAASPGSPGGAPGGTPGAAR